MHDFTSRFTVPFADLQQALQPDLLSAKLAAEARERDTSSTSTVTFQHRPERCGIGLPGLTQHAKVQQPRSLADLQLTSVYAACSDRVNLLLLRRNVIRWVCAGQHRHRHQSAPLNRQLVRQCACNHAYRGHPQPGPAAGRQSCGVGSSAWGAHLRRAATQCPGVCSAGGAADPALQSWILSQVSTSMSYSPVHTMPRLL